MTKEDHQNGENEENARKQEELEALAGELGFRESEAMVALRAQAAEIEDFESAKGIFIQYRILGEAEVEKVTDQEGLSLAQIGLLIGMAALYWENNRFFELEEFFFQELDDAYLAASHLQDKAKRQAFSQRIKAL